MFPAASTPRPFGAEAVVTGAKTDWRPGRRACALSYYCCPLVLLAVPMDNAGGETAVKPSK
jgi:hypothetical protein